MLKSETSRMGRCAETAEACREARRNNPEPFAAPEDADHDQAGAKVEVKSEE